MSVRTTLRVVLSAILAASILPTVAAAQSQEPESITEAARRARERKKAVAKPAKSFTNDDVKPAPPAEPAATQDSSAPPSATAPDAPAKDGKDAKDSKELADLKEQVKQAQADYELSQRARALQEDSFYSNPSYARDAAGKAKLETLVQQTKDKKQALDALKAKLDSLLQAQSNPSTAPTPKP
jgi:hypothetical protein